jgi:hypothetical protein
MKDLSILRKMRAKMSKQIQSTEQIRKMRSATGIKNKMIDIRLLRLIEAQEIALEQIETEIRYAEVLINLKDEEME